ncbi:hypothetical protein [Neosynechococcus sphagnicola]|nr:hypothetical protein [Neosynechococcus sphagnicola]
MGSQPREASHSDAVAHGIEAHESLLITYEATGEILPEPNPLM